MKAMSHFLIPRFQRCSDLQSVLDCLLSQSLEMTGAALGNVQLMDWGAGYLTIAAQRGFNSEFLSFFRRVKTDNGSAWSGAKAAQHNFDRRRATRSSICALSRDSTSGRG
jgi:hypothetical protein